MDNVIDQTGDNIKTHTFTYDLHQDQDIGTGRQKLEVLVEHDHENEQLFKREEMTGSSGKKITYETYVSGDDAHRYRKRRDQDEDHPGSTKLSENGGVVRESEILGFVRSLWFLYHSDWEFEKTSRYLDRDVAVFTTNPSSSGDESGGSFAVDESGWILTCDADVSANGSPHEHKSAFSKIGETAVTEPGWLQEG